MVERGTSGRAVLPVLASAALLAAGCRTPAGIQPTGAGLAVSALPNLGLSAEGGVSLGRVGSFDTELSARLTHQFLDDSDFADDGFPSAGDWTQLDVGWLARLPLAEHRAATLRLAATWMRARGQPNILDHPGDYFGAGLGLGVRTRVARNWTFGPELLVFLGYGEGEYVKTPQLTWGLYWTPARPSEAQPHLQSRRTP